MYLMGTSNNGRLCGSGLPSFTVCGNGRLFSGFFDVSPDLNKVRVYSLYQCFSLFLYEHA